MNPILLAFLVSAVCSYPIFILVKKLKSLQVISQHVPEGHQLKVGTPNMGGLMILVGAIAGIAWHSIGSMDAWLDHALLTLLIGFGLIGFTDDYLVPKFQKGSRGLRWKHKLLMQIAVAWAAIAIAGIRQPLEVGAMLFVILFYCNAYNFSDGLDGLAGGLGLLLFLGIGLAAVQVGASGIVVASGCLAAGLLVFLAYNRPKASVFMGDTGSLPVGAVLGFMGMMLVMGSRFPTMNGAAFLVLSGVMVAELVPVPLQIFWVKVFKKRLFPFTPIHHAFEKAGWKETRVTLMFIIVQALLLGAAAVIYPTVLD